MVEERRRGHAVCKAPPVAVSQPKLNLSLPILVNHHSSGWLGGLLAWFLA